jgi:hypothetical protein
MGYLTQRKKLKRKQADVDEQWKAGSMMPDVAKGWDVVGDSDVRSVTGRRVSTIGMAMHMCLWDRRRRRASPTEATIRLISDDDPKDSDDSDAVDDSDDNSESSDTEVALECPEERMILLKMGWTVTRNHRKAR